MRAEIIRQIEDNAINAVRKGLCHCDTMEGKLIMARTMEVEARKTVNAILEDNPRWSK